MALLSWADSCGLDLSRTGAWRRGIWPVERLEYLCRGVLPAEAWDLILAGCPHLADVAAGQREATAVPLKMRVKFFQVPPELFGFAQISHTGPESWVRSLRQRSGWDQGPAWDEDGAFARIGFNYAGPEERGG